MNISDMSVNEYKQKYRRLYLSESGSGFSGRYDAESTV